MPIKLKSDSGIFQHVDKALCTLYVPVGSKRAYHQVEPWSEFENIFEITEFAETKFSDIEYLVQRKQYKIN